MNYTFQTINFFKKKEREGEGPFPILPPGQTKALFILEAEVHLAMVEPGSQAQENRHSARALHLQTRKSRASLMRVTAGEPKRPRSDRGGGGMSRTRGQSQWDSRFSQGQALG